MNGPAPQNRWTRVPLNASPTDGEKTAIAVLQQAVGRIDDIVAPWGFQFTMRCSGYSHTGGYADGVYTRGPTRILVFVRAEHGFAGIVYQQESVCQEGYLKTRTVYQLGHPGYMERLGHSDDCQLIKGSVARDGGDAVSALIHDLREFAAPTLQAECNEFDQLIRTGWHYREVL